MWRRSLGISLLVVLMVGCNKYRPDPLEGELSYLVGTWAWDSAHHEYNWCTGGSTLEEMIYPEDYGTDFKVLLSKDGYVSFFANDSLLETQGVTLDGLVDNGGGNKHVVFIQEKGSRIAIVGTVQQSRIVPFPFSGEAGCEDYDNYFSKQ